MPEFVQSKMTVIEIGEPIELIYPIETLERWWAELGDIPVNDNGIIQESFLWWRKGTDREDIWRWFDEKYSGGVVKLMGLEENNASEDL